MIVMSSIGRLKGGAKLPLTYGGEMQSKLAQTSPTEKDGDLLTFKSHTAIICDVTVSFYNLALI